MDSSAPSEIDVRALSGRLRDRFLDQRGLVMVDVVRAFLEISLLPCEQKLWSLAFAFDEDEGHVAHLEARFANHGFVTGKDLDHLQGYDVEVLLPKFIAACAKAEEDRAIACVERELDPTSLGARFLHALSNLGAYRTIEVALVRSATVYLL
jgi:hypothetical protein